MRWDFRVIGPRLGSRVTFAALVASGCAAMADGPLNQKPPFIRGEILETRHEGPSDDLLTAGLGKTGLAGAAPAVSSPPTAAELRRLAIYNNYRALVDITAGGGYGTLYGPNVDPEGNDTLGEGLIPGTEFLAFAGTRRENVTLMVQVPDGFDPANACIVTGPSSGSRGVYGAIATSGEWGLKRGCAVAYTDKGTGIGAHDLQDNTVNLITGERADADVAGDDSNFTARLSDPAREAFNAATPDRFAWKHAHSEQNPEKDWGRDVLRSIELAFFVLNEKFGEPQRSGKRRKTITAENTIVIASSVSNGGGASIRAAEQDRQGLIDGVAVSEPNVNPRFDPSFGIQQGDGEPLFEHSKSLIDYTTLVHLYQGCANRDPALAAAPLNLTPASLGDNACASLRDKGLVSGNAVEEQSADAQQILNDFGILPEQNVVQPSHYWAFVPQAVAVTYANAYSRSRVVDNLCGYSFGATLGNILSPDLANPDTGLPQPLAEAAEAVLFGTGNGIPPTGGVNLINNLSDSGPREDRVSTSPSSGLQDQNLDGALCLRSLVLGEDPTTGAPLPGPLEAVHRKLLRGVEQIRASGDLDGLPTLIVTGRNDAVLPPNHTSRAYVGLNQVIEGGDGNIRYYEVTNAQHLDAFNAFAGFDARFVPLHHYFIQALDLLFDHLKTGTDLPPSQVVHTVPRGGTPGSAPPIDAAVNLPPIDPSAAAGDLITFSDDILRVPD
jgi:hydroxybutyrate-dimer hydrolase